MKWADLELQSARLWLRPFSAADAGEVYDAITPTLTRFMAFDPPASRAAFAVIWQGWLLTIAQGSDLTFVLRHRQTEAFIGLAGLHEVQAPEPELGIWVAEPVQGHGYGCEAVRAVATWCSETFAPAAFRYPVAEANHASRRIAQIMGGEIVAHETTPKYASVVYRIPAAKFQGVLSSPSS